jgi:hypothetical protein
MGTGSTPVLAMTSTHSVMHGGFNSYGERKLTAWDFSAFARAPERLSVARRNRKERYVTEDLTTAHIIPSTPDSRRLPDATGGQHGGGYQRDRRSHLMFVSGL